MSEQTEQDQGIEHLLNPPAEQAEAEAQGGKRGLIPDRWLQIEAVETERLQTSMEETLQERVKNWKEGEIDRRRTTVREYFGDLMHAPSFQGGPYAADRWLNMYEMLPRIIDIKQDEVIVPDVDNRVPFSSLGLEKQAIIKHWLVDRIQGVLPEEQKLTEVHLRDCFTNVTEQQLTAVIDQIARSGLTLMPESPKEHWQRIVAESSSQK
jgi:hypothetical protein